MASVSYGTKRFVRSVRNLFSDPPPRRRTLVLAAARPDGEGVEFAYTARGRRYRIHMVLPAPLAAGLPALPEGARAQVLTAIGLAFAPFLFKLSDFATVRVGTAPLDERARAFFGEFLRGGLGEFRYLQGLDPSRPIRVEANGERPPAPMMLAAREELLMLNGGGKDTIVAAELLKAGGQPFTWLTIRPNATRRRVVALSGNPDAIEVGYEVDEEIDRHRAYPWGHVPHTSIVLAIGVLVAMLTGRRYVAAGNERSANFGNVRHRGFEVNHQYTKSFAFERGFADFVSRCVSPDIRVFSILRPFHDLQLARLFAGHSTYLPHFISCNNGIRAGTWCKACPKCAFTALALYPFLTSEQVALVFGEDILQRPVIRRHILDLVRGAVRPWECVGTREECALALSLLLARNPGLRFSGEPGRAALEEAVAGVDAARLEASILAATHPEHAIPAPLVTRLNASLGALGAPLIAPAPAA